VLVLVTIIVLVYISRGAHQTHNSDFYTKTEQALQEREHAEAARVRDAESVKSRLQAAEEQIHCEQGGNRGPGQEGRGRKSGD
jgi:hypothetical protein